MIRQIKGSHRVRSLLIVLLLACTSACSTLPEVEPQPREVALEPATAGKPAELAAEVAATFGVDQSSFLMIQDAKDALLWRMALADLATQSIDIQYFIWQGDETSGLLFDRLIRAADRGVRVRLLVDDLVLASSDEEIGAISRHPNIHIKLYNPSKARKGIIGPLGDFMSRFRELNRRMHNKLFVIDNSVAIIGGRNIGNPYFGLSETYNFSDLDLIMVGPVVPEVSIAFDQYWNSEKAYPGSAFAADLTQEEVDALFAQVERDRAAHAELLQSYPVDKYDWDTEWSGLLARMETGTAHFLQDVPIDVDGKAMRLSDMIDHISAPIERELLIASPYLIPSQDYLQALERTASSGVKVRIITSGLDSNNHTAAHSHYKKYRKQLLATGAELYEFKSQPSQAIRDLADVDPVVSKFIALHAKTMSADDEICFIGSLNLDPRAVDINTENGAYIESAGLCSRLSNGMRQLMAPENAWRVQLGESGGLRWTSSEGTVDRQPARSGGQRVSDFFFRLLPIESQL